jgi:hypothetical protein
METNLTLTFILIAVNVAFFIIKWVSVGALFYVGHSLAEKLGSWLRKLRSKN